MATLHNDLPGDEAGPDAVDLIERVMTLLEQHPGDAEGRRRLDDLIRWWEAKRHPEAAQPPQWAPVDEWPQEGTGWEPTQWLIKQWLPAGRVTLLSGQGAVGKTRVAMQLAANLAAGYERPFLDGGAGLAGTVPHFETKGETRVVWASWETAPGDFQERLKRTSRETDLTRLVKKLTYVNMRPHGALWGPDTSAHVSTGGGIRPGGVRLMDFSRDYGAILLVIDPLAAAYAGNENDRSLVRPFLSFLAQWADETGCAVLILAHPPKSGSEGYSGSTDWDAGVQARLTLQPCNCQAQNKGKGKGKGKQAAQPCQVRLLSADKLNEGALPPPLAFRWDNNLGTLGLVDHDNNTKSPGEYRQAVPYGGGLRCR